MFGGMLILGAVAAADVPARETQPEMRPLVADFQALFAPFRAWLHFSDFFDVLAGFAHRRVSDDVW